MNIAITGASGFIGRHLTAFFTEQGHRVVPLGRPMFREGMLGYLVQALSHCDVIINLAGAPVNKRWTPEYKHELYDSRIRVTQRIVRALGAGRQKPRLMLSASAVGYYPSAGTFDEYTNTRGEGFLPDLCYAWEKEARRCPFGHSTFRTCTFSGRRSNGTDAPALEHEVCRRHRSRHTTFSVDQYR